MSNIIYIADTMQNIYKKDILKKDEYILPPIEEYRRIRSIKVKYKC